jgi:amidase
MTDGELLELASRYRVAVAPGEIATYREHVTACLAALERLETLYAGEEEAPVARDAGAPPDPERNPLNAWAWRCEITRPGAEGLLSGRRVAVKDNIAVAGVPMRVGSRMFEGYVPRLDATLVERLLDAGATIAGKAECEALCFSSGSHTAVSGPVRNPHDPSRSAGGSSGGSAALVATDAVELAIGSDSAGSIRTPSAYCGVYGLKPTAGLVPGSGVWPLERTLDCPGPIARTPADLALLLDVIARAEGSYGAQLEAGVEGLRVGVLEEGFGWPSSEPEVDEAVRGAIAALGELGARVEPVSVPRHRDGIDIWTGIAMEGALESMIRSHGGGTNTRTWTDPEMIRAFRDARREAGLDLSPSATVMILAGELAQRSGRYHYAVARRLAQGLAAAYDGALDTVDLLALPTNPMKPPSLPAVDDPLEVRLARSTEPILNTCPFNVTGHPAISVPGARAGGLPVGLMLVARRHGESELLRAAAALERA